MLPWLTSFPIVTLLGCHRNTFLVFDHHSWSRVLKNQHPSRAYSRAGMLTLFSSSLQAASVDSFGPVFLLKCTLIRWLESLFIDRRLCYGRAGAPPKNLGKGKQPIGI
jgi:hypothetical protein